MIADVGRHVDPPAASDPGIGAVGGRRLESGKMFASCFSLLLAGVTLSPLAEHRRETPRDNFPLSYYPMFTARRGKTEKVVYLEGVDARGEWRPIPYKYAGSGGLNQVRRQIRRVVRRGRAEELCRAVAAEVGGRVRGALADVVEVRVVTGEYHLGDYFTGRDKAPVSEVVHASARIERERP